MNNPYQINNPLGYERLKCELTGFQFRYFGYLLHYNWNPDKKKWDRKQNQFVRFGHIPTMASVTDIGSELFHLHLLLLHYCGGTSFRDTKTINLTEYKIQTRITSCSITYNNII